MASLEIFLSLVALRVLPAAESKPGHPKQKVPSPPIPATPVGGAQNPFHKSLMIKNSRNSNNWEAELFSI